VPRLLVSGTPSDAILQIAVDWLRQGRVVVYPTDTFYGLAADPTSATALRTLFALKGRPLASALPFVAASLTQVEAWCGPLRGRSARLAARFWPGPLAIVLDAPRSVDPAALGDAGSIAIRVPDHPVARALAAAWGAPLPATSANRTGEPAVRTPDALGAIADDASVLVMDAGAAPGGDPSTIVDARGGEPRLLREGAIAWNRVLDFLEG
jgi:L-threonylcarbamoyladenylate synthase